MSAFSLIIRDHETKEVALSASFHADLRDFFGVLPVACRSVRSRSPLLPFYSRQADERGDYRNQKQLRGGHNCRPTIPLHDKRPDWGFPLRLNLGRAIVEIR